MIIKILTLSALKNSQTVTFVRQ